MTKVELYLRGTPGEFSSAMKKIKLADTTYFISLNKYSIFFL